MDTKIESLTPVDRWMLWNQYLILERVDPDKAADYRQAREVLEDGFEGCYKDLIPQLARDVLPAAACNEVVEILHMYWCLQTAYGALANKEGIEPDDIHFLGFDGNNETKLMAYAQYWCRPGSGRFEGLDRSEGFNSHLPMLDCYRRQLAEWRRQRPNTAPLTTDDMKRIIRAGR